MNLYPALQAEMGSWKYYIVKMKMREVASEVRFATEIYTDKTLDEAIQRELKEGRVRKEIATFLIRRKDRFFSSLVVAAIGGSPKFYPVKITDDPQFQFFADQGIDQAFGVLTFSGDQKYYALDGQHRLKAIKTLLDRNDEVAKDCPPGFEDEQISVLIVVKREEPMSDFLTSYRRLFSSLNRYAKPTDRDTNIIMDEDDSFAILTRRVISEYPFFRWVRGTDSPKVKTKGKNIRNIDPHFTSLQTLYAMNQELLSAAWRRNVGWGPDGGEKDVSQFMRFRPTQEEYLDELYDELVVYWDGLLEALPVLKEEPVKYRVHNIDPADEVGVLDHLLFWPIGQELLAAIARRLLDQQGEDQVKSPTVGSTAAALRPLQKVSWDLHKTPWKHFVLTADDEGWRMRSEDRSEVMGIAEELVRWIVGIDDLRDEEIDDLRKRWQARLVPAQPEDAAATMWKEVVEQKKMVSKG